VSEFVVRRLLVDLETPVARHWNGGDAFRTALMNALSFSFPAGEQFFIDAVRRGAERLPPAERDAFAGELRGFVGQEATHRRIHARFNEHLHRQGLDNAWERRILQRRQRMEGADLRAWVGVTAAAEHLTAVLAGYLLAHPDQALAGAEPRLRQLWLWHASEELEHRSTAFDLYRAIGGNLRWRRRLFVVVSVNFGRDLLGQTWRNLKQDGSAWRAATWAGALRLFLGRDGLLRRGFAPWCRYFARDFHPAQGEGSAGAAWLAAHAELAPPVGTEAPR